MWITQLTSDLKGLKVDRHISQLTDLQTFVDIYKGTPSNSLAQAGLHKVTVFNGALDFVDSGGKPLLYAIHICSSGEAWWEMAEECFHRRALFQKHEIIEYKFGYIAGTHSPYGPERFAGLSSAALVNGYQMWEDVKVKQLE